MANENIRKEYSGGAVATTLAAGISASATSITLVAGSSYPTGAVGPFVVAIGRNTGGAEEHILCSSRSGNILTVLNRGYDGTTAAIHDAGDTVLHVLDANSINQVNLMANIGTTAGDMLYFTAAGVVARRAIGTAGYPMIVSGGVPNWQRLANVGIDPAAAIDHSKMGSVPRAHAYQTVAQSVTQNTNQALSMGSELYDTSSIHSTVSNSSRMTVPTGLGGLWSFGYAMFCAGPASSGSAFASWMLVNGGAVDTLRYGFMQAEILFAQGIINNGAAQIVLAEGDYVELIGYQNSPGALNMGVDGNAHYGIWCHYIGPSS